ncbi:MAG: TonB-dependent receptor domain-containing protein [Salibacteraceae bacterium]
MGAVTDMDGYYSIPNVPVGRITLQASFVGYVPQTRSNLPLSTGKELVINFELQESVITTKEVEIKASRDKTETLNKMATTSARTFSIEESQRYAGARNDVSRMASNFAGVRGGNDAVNDIVIRGNSPVGLLWRLEGVDIPNPNHFGELGSTGGPVSILNNNVLSNSDFLTGAFPAEYHNALSGVFDLQMRSGNDQKHEFLGQVGFNGFEFGAEGPLSREKRSSYLINYRYSTISLVSQLGLEVGTGTAIPYYQDLTFKFNFPSRKYGNLSIFGLGGSSNIDFVASEDSEEESEEDDNLFTGDDVDVYVKSRQGVIGVKHTYLFNNSTYSKVSIAATGITNRNIVDSIGLENNQVFDFYRQNLTNSKVFASFLLNKKLSAKHNFRAGAFVQHFISSLQDSVFVTLRDDFQVLTDYEGSTQLISPYLQWQYRPTDNLTVNTGLNFSYLALSGATSLEPRLGVKWKLDASKSLSFAYGLHSQMLQLYNYFREVRQPDGTNIRPNEDLDFTKSHHLVVGYDWSFSPNMRLKAEAYYQRIFNAVVEETPSSFSSLNAGSFSGGFPDYLKNGGTGENYGVELTLERFLDRGYYFLTTTSLYQSTYEGSDGIEREGAFDSDYVFNILGGKEFQLQPGVTNKRYNKLILVDLRFTAAGGQRFTPVDVEASIREAETVFVEEEAFSERFKNYARADIRVAFRLEAAKFSQEFAFDVQNLTDRENPYTKRFNRSTGEVQTINQLGIFPLIQYRIEF